MIDENRLSEIKSWRLGPHNTFLVGYLNSFEEGNELLRLARIGFWADESAHAAMCFVLDKLNCAVLETKEPLSLSSLAKLKARIEESLDTYPEEYK